MYYHIFLFNFTEFYYRMNDGLLKEKDENARVLNGIQYNKSQLLLNVGFLHDKDRLSINFSLYLYLPKNLHIIK